MMKALCPKCGYEFEIVGVAAVCSYCIHFKEGKCERGHRTPRIACPDAFIFTEIGTGELKVELK